MEDVIRFLCAFTISDRGTRRLGNESLLELMPTPELQQRLKLTNTFGCSHISRVGPDQFWVSDNRTNLILFNKKGNIQTHLENEIYSDVYDVTGAHTVSINYHLIYIDTNNKIVCFFDYGKIPSALKIRTISGYIDACIAHCYPATY